jgi:hypothetical protein
MVEIDFQAGQPIRAGDQFGLGGAGALKNDATAPVP